jgi:hypothetical protein
MENNKILSTDFYKQLKLCITIQEKIDEYNNKIKALKEKKEQLEESLIPYMIKKELTKKALQYNERKIYIKNEKTYTNLSYKYLNEKINKFFKYKNPELVEQLLVFLKEERDIKVTQVLNL